MGWKSRWIKNEQNTEDSNIVYKTVKIYINKYVILHRNNSATKFNADAVW
jgi:uncharacterized protein (DUF927 family)